MPRGFDRCQRRNGRFQHFYAASSTGSSALSLAPKLFSRRELQYVFAILSSKQLKRLCCMLYFTNFVREPTCGCFCSRVQTDSSSPLLLPWPKAFPGQGLAISRCWMISAKPWSGDRSTHAATEQSHQTLQQLQYVHLPCKTCQHENTVSAPLVFGSSRLYSFVQG